MVDAFKSNPVGRAFHERTRCESVVQGLRFFAEHLHQHGVCGATGRVRIFEGEDGDGEADNRDGTAGDDETAELVKRFQAEAGTCKRFVLDGVSKSVVESIRRTQTTAVTTEECCCFGDLVDVCANARIGFEEFLKRSTDNGVHAAINVVADKVVQLGWNTRSCIGRVVTVYHTLSARGLLLTAKKRVSIFNTDPLQQFRIWSAQSSTGV